MKKVAILITVIILMGSMSFGQDITPAPSAEPSVGPSAGRVGVLFQFDGLSTLRANSYATNGFGAKLFLSDYMAVRGMVQFSLSSTKTPANPDTAHIGADGSTSDNLFLILH